MASVFQPGVFQPDVFQVGASGGIVVTASFVDGNDAVQAAAVVAQPAAQTLPSGRPRRRQGWRYDVPSWPVIARARFRDADDLVQAASASGWPRIVARTALIDDDDELLAACAVTWPPVRYVRGLRLVRTERLTMIRNDRRIAMVRAA